MLIPTLIKKKKNIGWEHKLAFKNYVRIFYKYFLFTWDFFHASNYFVRIVSSNISYLREIFSTRVIILSELCRQIFLIYVRFFPIE